MTDDRITWCGAPDTTAAELLQRAGRVVSRIATDGAKLADQQARAPRFPDDPTEHAAWYEARESWRRSQIGSPVMDGLHLPRLPWSPEPVDLIAELCAFALASLERIDALHKEARAADADVAHWKRKHTAATAAAEQAALTAAAALSEAQDATADLRALLAAAQADAAQARREALDASRDRDAAQGQAEAWRTTATAVQDALHTLRAALRIPSPGDDAGLVLRGGA